MSTDTLATINDHLSRINTGFGPVDSICASTDEQPAGLVRVYDDHEDCVANADKLAAALADVEAGDYDGAWAAILASKAARTVTATVTAYEGPEPCDWEGYVLEQFEQLYPGAEIEVSYGSRNEAFVDEEPLSDFSQLCEDWWGDLCNQGDHWAWGEEPGYQVKVTKVAASSTCDTKDAVDAEVVITIGSETFEGEVTLFADHGRKTKRRRYPLTTCGSPIEYWADDMVISALAAADALGINRLDVIGEIEASVTAHADATMPAHF